MSDRLVILAGGVSSRMKQSSPSLGLDAQHESDADGRIKSMIRFGNPGRPFLDYLLYNARKAGYTEILIVVGEGDRDVRSHYGSRKTGNRFHGLTISYALQRIPPFRMKPLGTADALMQALIDVPEWRGTCFTVCNSDNLYSVEAFAAMRQFAISGALVDYDRDALGLDAERAGRFAVIKKTPDNYLETIIERPSDEEVDECRSAQGRVGVSMNIFRFNYECILPFLRSVPEHPLRREKELPAAVRLMVKVHPCEMRVIECAEAVPDLTSKEDIRRMEEYLARSFPQELWEMVEQGI